MRMYDYIVSYNFSADGFIGPCCGTMELSRERKITTFDELNKVRDFILDNLSKDMTGVKNVSIHNIILLGRNRN